MVKQKNRILLFALMTAMVMTTGCLGCGAKETGNEGDGQLQESVQQTAHVQESGTELEDEDAFERGEFPEPLPLLDEELFGYEMWEPEKTKVEIPGGVLAVGENILVCDMGSHCVVRLTTDGDFVQSYGELGSAIGNFVTPTAILLHENEIYVLDSGNMRIQIFDMDMNFVREILFEGNPLPSNGKYNDMAIAGDGTIYITADAAYGDARSLFYIEGEELCAVPGGGLGYLAEQDGIVYTADKWRYYRYDGGYGWRPGENWIYRVDRTGLQKVCELPYMYAPVDFAVKNDMIYMISNVWGEVNQFTMDGEVLSTMLYVVEIQGNEMYLSVQDENTFYVADTEGNLYKVFHMGGEE